jgi:uncharacterized phiE125 gp8 family phage protein
MAGTVTGENILVDRFPFGESEKALPVSAEIIREHVQTPGNYDDQLLLGMNGYLASATEDVENRGCVSLIRQKRIQIVGAELIPNLVGETVHLTRGPILSITAVKYLDENDVTQTLSPSLYRPIPLFSGVYFKGPMPAMAEGPASLWIEYESGYGNTPDTIPAAWASCVMTLAMRKYDFRGGDSGNTNDSWERMFRHMIRNAGDSSHRA